VVIAPVLPLPLMAVTVTRSVMMFSIGPVVIDLLILRHQGPLEAVETLRESGI
jgi:hypothetical protein